MHARLVLVHAPHRARALTAMTAALRPGGWLLVEETDPTMRPLVCPDEAGPPPRLANTLKRDVRALLSQRGVDLSYGRTVARLSREASLVDVQAGPSDVRRDSGDRATRRHYRASGIRVRVSRPPAQPRTTPTATYAFVIMSPS
ncbi:MAG: hypothetical protein ACRDQH_00395 [Pseudonocardiaceae bacterium]